MSLSLNYPTISPSLLLDFANSGRLDPRVTFTRSSTATFFDETGVLRTANNDVPRLDYNLATLAAQGLLIEESRTNGIRNNTAQGAVAGTPGTLPTNWAYLEAGSELVAAVVGTGTENGITYIDIKVSGTVTAQRSALIFFETSTGVAASASQSWTESLYLKLQAGSTANIEQINIRTDYYNSTPTFISSTVGSALTVTSAALNTQRQSNSVTTPALTAYIQPILRVRSNASGAIDITIRIGLPQLELGAFATSVIPTTTTALTRAADVASVNTLSPWFNASEGTLFAEASGVATNVGGTGSLFSFDDGTTANRIITFVLTSGLQPAFRVISGGSDQANFTAGVISLGATFKLAAAYATNDFAATVNGGTVQTGTTGNVPTGQTTARLGVNVASAAHLNGYLRRITYYPRKLSSAQLQAITV
jgi:hypothetical protein